MFSWLREESLLRDPLSNRSTSPFASPRLASPVKGSLLFDLDGTLTDAREGIVRCMRHALEQVHVQAPSDAELVRFIGPPLRHSLRELLGPSSTHLLPPALAAYRERFATVGMFDNLYASISEMISDLAREP